MNSLQLRLGAVSALAVLSLAPMCKADTWDKKTTIHLTAPTEVPGKVLAPGTYVMKLLNVTPNRHVVEIQNENESQTYAITFTAAAHRVLITDKTVLTFYEGRGDSPRALRTWFYPDDYDGQEFIYYGKDKARLLAVSNTTPVEESALNTQQESTTTTATTETPAPSANEEVIPAAQIPPPIQTQQAETTSEEPTLLAQAEPPAQTNDQTSQAAPRLDFFRSIAQDGH